MMIGSGSSSRPGGGLFFSFGDSPFLIEDSNIGQADVNIKKLGKATGNHNIKAREIFKLGYLD